MPRYRVVGDFHYEAWPETVHAARWMRKLAREAPGGQLHLLSAAIVMTAFSVEAFAQTLGPSAYGADWLKKPGPGERDSVLAKLKRIGKVHEHPVDLGKAPWKELGELLEARDELAHPKPKPLTLDFEVIADDEFQMRELLDSAVHKKYNPMHDIDRLDRVADEVESGLLSLWVAAGHKPHILSGWGRGGYWAGAVD